MTTLGMATQSETFERLDRVLDDHGITVVGLPVSGRVIDLADPDWPAFDIGLVFPSRVVEGAALAAAADRPWINDRSDVLTSRNKAAVHARLERAGLPTPTTRLVSNPADRAAVLAAADAIGYPVVVKPTSTTRGVGVTRAPDPDTLAGIVDYIDLVQDYAATGDKSYLLQAFVPQARDVRAMVIDGTCVGGVERRHPDDRRWRHNVHRGARAEGVDLDERLRALAERVAATLDVDFLGVDLLVGPDGPVVGETNARPTVDAVEKYDSDAIDRFVALIEKTCPP
ncbi:ATP-grasp domain-containing protein [Halococcoides cellulosivorans]|uniref:RimK family alpha-L-glutamate ligase n=1 Tax=Halococcoides cellulosivorans TaxID=1679096 RepID=A0A2R4X0L7_9EURY|nr:ATP-grasp domain-containing protein [Halococcoides cellulosivorans]AWB27352.1 RimK family alpha-L-glutamate ligase [Halococcoides cellulosivorans]